MRMIQTATLEIAYRESGPPDGPVAVLMHGFPDDPHAYDATAADLAARGWRVLVPWLRGYGPTRFRHPATPRSGEQAALGADLRDFLDALGIVRPILAGYDWGGRACCVVAALWPDRVRGLVSMGGYNIQHLASAGRPASVEQELAFWYQWYFQTERGRAGLAAHRRAIGERLWRMWSPNWRFSAALLDRVAAAWDNPDYVEVVIHSYRHRHNAAAGDPALAAIEAALAARPAIAVPAINLEGAADGVGGPAHPDPDTARFTAAYERRILDRVGHFVPHEAPEAVTRAILDLANAHPVGHPGGRPVGHPGGRPVGHPVGRPPG